MRLREWNDGWLSEALKLVGHKTEAIYRRYAIVVESDLLAGGEKLDGLHQIHQQTQRKIRKARKPRGVLLGGLTVRFDCPAG